MRCACIDIGSNTTRLLVAEPGAAGGLREVESQRVFTRLHAAGGTFGGAQIDSVAQVVAGQVARARACGALHVCVVATAAVRAAANGDALCAAVRAAAGEPVTVLSGEDEARLAFLGATATLAAPPAGCVAVVDVGGGSSEVVCGSVPGGVTWSVSLPAGSGGLTERFLHGDPPSPAERERLAEHVAALFAPLRPPAAAAAYAVGGSATSLRRLAGAVLDEEAFARAGEAVCAAPAAAVARRFALHPERARLLPAGMALLGAASGLLGLPLQIAAGGLREGVLLERFAAGRAH